MAANQKPSKAPSRLSVMRHREKMRRTHPKRESRYRGRPKAAYALADPLNFWGGLINLFGGARR